MKKLERELAKLIERFREFVLREKGRRIRMDIWTLFVWEIAVVSVIAWVLFILGILTIVHFLIRR